MFLLFIGRAILGRIQKTVERFLELINGYSATDKLRGFNSLGIFGIGNAEEEAWCSANVQLGAFRDIRLNLCCIFSAIQALLEFWNVQSQYKRIKKCEAQLERNIDICSLGFVIP